MKKQLLKKIGLLLALMGFSSTPLMAQTTLTAGDIAIVGYKAVNTNQGAIAFILLKDIEAGTVINISNRSWLSAQTGFSGSYGVDDVYTWTATNAIPFGTILTLGTGESVTRVTNNVSSNVGTVTRQSAVSGATTGFNLLSNNSFNGDSVLFYQHSGAFAEPTDGASTAWITGIKTGIDWGEIKANTANSFCAKPTALEGFTITFPFSSSMQNGVYNGELVGTASSLRAKINNPANWTINSNVLNDGGSHIYRLWSYAESDGTNFGQIGKAGTLSVKDFNKTSIAANVSPNPVSSILNIASDVVTKKYKIVNLAGATVLETEATGSIDVSTLANGIYLLVTDAGIAKIIKE
ncbi:T9SS type A sorting domain-containing protein [Flavobacterium sp. UMI-01]|uniref:T9SS type A sorting domain-containing protein n=1 Tax=Flavobacterium sp. UMI-01 TaxID=1441053 RepID=UPI001C7D2EC3|nr:T9SS type A sorting domain-containing protein [Flavobacterium sp. UMI-01]GIZ08010.1 hypothetical protein FUMI01_07370 [Flavobacterium sp. UMI-01]